jgi:hypothetical protein
MSPPVLPVPCPQCGTVLKAPPEAVGRRVKCKKCEARFVIPAPGAAPVAPPPDIVGDSQMLSAVESLPAVPAQLFAFDSGPKPALDAAPAPANPFGFDDGDAVVSVGKSKPTKKPAKAAKPEEAELELDEEVKTKPVKPASNKKLFVLLGCFFFVAIFGCSGLSAGLTYLLISPSKVITPATTPKATEPAPAPPPAPVVTKPEPKAKANKTAPTKAKETPPPDEAK